MANEPIQNGESLTSFNERIKLLQEGVHNLLAGFLEEETARQGPDGASRRSRVGSLWASLSKEQKSVPLEDIVGYVMNNCEVPSRIPNGIVEQRPLISPFKKRIGEQPTVLRDLSRIYRSVRDHHSIQRGNHREPLMFGDIADNIVHHIYEIRNPANASLISQFIYLAGICGFFFEELERQRDLNEEMHQLFDEVQPRRVKRNKHLLLMLRRDLFLLAARSMAIDYLRAGLSSSGGQYHEVNWGLSRTRGELRGSEARKMAQGFYDVPMLTALYEYLLTKYRSAPREDKGDATDPAYLLLTALCEMVLDEKQRRLNRGLVLRTNRDAIERDIPATNWGEIKFGREAPFGAQKEYFPDSELPMIVTVDPAPGKAYLAVVSITTKKAFVEKLQRTSSRELALDLTSPLRKSFSARAKKDEETLCFFVSKDEGELYTYGDSNALARRQLGSYDYASFKKIAHHALRNLMDVTYIPKVVPRTGLEIEMPRSAPQPAVIPDQPIPRATAHEQQDPSPEQDTIAFRRAHNRILPEGMFMSALAYENGRKSGQLDFWALREGVHAGADGRQIPTLTYIEKLDLSNGYDALLRQRDRILAEHKDERIRFQTYVSQSGDVASEDLE